jgi:Family of unknown function (DUF6065)
MDPDGPPVLTAYQLGGCTMEIVPAPAHRDWMSSTKEQFANRCLPLLIANQHGWLLLNDVPFRVHWTGSDRLDALTVTPLHPTARPRVRSHFGHGVLTWTLPFLFRTSPGHNLLVRGPANWPKDGAYPLEGVVESDWTASTFTMNWLITRPFTDVRFDAGEPFCMLVPQRRGELESFEPRVRRIDEDDELRRRYGHFTSSRSEFLRRLRTLRPGRDAWQRDYFRGLDADGTVGSTEHQSRLHLRPFPVDQPGSHQPGPEPSA